MSVYIDAALKNRSQVNLNSIKNLNSVVTIKQHISGLQQMKHFIIE